MATKTQITRLGQRIEALANLQAANVQGKVPIIIVDSCTEEEAAERHYKAHPGDRGANRKIFLHVVHPPAR